MNNVIEQTVMGLKLDRSEWTLVKFGDVNIFLSTARELRLGQVWIDEHRENRRL